MKLLISAYACAPNRGSDHGVGWNWTIEAHRLGHEIWALASSAHRDSIEAACRESPDLGQIHWVFPEVSGWPLKQTSEPRWERTYNFLWQRAALRHVRALQARVKFDALHHLTWAGIRAPTYLGGLDAPLIVGPVGGGETSPPGLRDALGFRGRLLERIRDFSSAMVTLSPITRAGLVDAAVIFASTSQTRDLFKGPLRDKTIVFSQLGLPGLPVRCPPRIWNDAPKFLYAGRLLYWKGVHIALLAFAELVGRVKDARLTIVGDGPERPRLQRDVKRYNLQENVEFIPRLPQAEFFKLYDDHDVLLFPSLHDSGGFVTLEAFSRGMPVVCLDLGGPGDIVTPESGIVIETKGRNTAEVAAAMAEEISQLLDAPGRLAELSAGAFARAQDFILSDRVEELYQLAMNFIATSGR
jgi:glycosyltransferase involved in cell wall biosynthesis